MKLWTNLVKEEMLCINIQFYTEMSEKYILNKYLFNNINRTLYDENFIINSIKDSDNFDEVSLDLINRLLKLDLKKKN